MRFREANSADLEAVLRVHRLAFGQDEEAVLVENLLKDPSAQPLLSVIEESDGHISGHALYTALVLPDSTTPTRLSILAPLAVLPTHQRSGVGRGLIEFGCKLLSQLGVDLVFVLGDPLYYTRCGFTPAAPYGLKAPYAIEPPEAWMVRPLRPMTLRMVQGTVNCAQAMAHERYWRE